MNAQNTSARNHVTAVSKENYMFSESSSDKVYSASFTFRKGKNDSVADVLNKYFGGAVATKKITTWKKLKDKVNTGDCFV